MCVPVPLGIHRARSFGCAVVAAVSTAIFFPLRFKRVVWLACVLTCAADDFVSLPATTATWYEPTGKPEATKRPLLSVFTNMGAVLLFSDSIRTCAFGN